ncbi:hypothetical protein D3C80_1926550 [compost metagenome]
MLRDMAKLMQDYIVNALTSRLNQVGIESDAPGGGATAPLRLHAEDAQWRLARNPKGLLQDCLQTSIKNLSGAGLVPSVQ